MQQVILAAGKGSRLKTETTNKCLVTVGGKRLIDFSLELGESINASEILIIVGYNKEYIMDYVGNSYGGIPVKYVVQTPQKGIAHGIMVASEYITEDFFMCLSDEIILAPQIFDCVRFFYEKTADCVCGIVKDSQENIKKTYTIDLDPSNRILDIYEKPTFLFNNFKGTGFCFMSRQILNCLQNLKINSIRQEYEMGDWIRNAIQQNYNCYAYEIAQDAFNINTNEELSMINEILLSGETK